MLISGLTLGLGLLAVFMAILYRIFTYQSAGAPVPVVEGAAIPTVTRSALGLPADARLVSTSLDARPHGAHLRGRRRLDDHHLRHGQDEWWFPGFGSPASNGTETPAVLAIAEAERAMRRARRGRSMARKATEGSRFEPFPINGVLAAIVIGILTVATALTLKPFFPAILWGDRARHHRGAAPRLDDAQACPGGRGWPPS